MNTLDLEWKKRVVELYGEQGSAREHRHMEIAAIRFLLWTKKCVLFAKERGLHYGNPDILGVSKDRRMYEIEIKCSVADFRRDRKKASQAYYRQLPEKGRNYFYYLVSPHIANKVLPEVEDNFGLLTLDTSVGINSISGFDVVILKKATRIHDRRQTPKEMVEMVRHQSGTVLNLISKLHEARNEINFLNNGK